MKKVMGLDASSTTIGLCLLSYDDKKITLDHITYYKPPKKGNIFERLAAVRKYIEDKIDELKPDYVTIEDIVLFMKNKSSAATITTLAIVNRLIGLTVFDKLDMAPYLYNALRVRHAIKIGKDLPSKQEIPELVADILGTKFPYVKNKKGDNIKENEDMADAVAVGLCHIYMDRDGRSDLLQIKKKKKRKSKKK
jgi:Holliday junction resolvasome RuvABC endonuclease subunit